MTGRVKGDHGDTLDLDLFTVTHAHGDDVNPALLTHNGDAAGAVAKFSQAGDVICVDVLIYRFDQLEIEIVKELNVPINPLQHGI